jgi:hypothetical protein
MADEHLSLETMAKRLSGWLEHEAVVEQIVLVLLHWHTRNCIVP